MPELPSTLQTDFGRLSAGFDVSFALVVDAEVEREDDDGALGVGAMPAAAAFATTSRARDLTPTHGFGFGALLEHMQTLELFKLTASVHIGRSWF